MRSLIGLVLLWFYVGTAYAAPAPAAWAFWNAAAASNPASIDHRLWDSLLTRYLDARHASGIARFAYAKVSVEDKRRLRDYLKVLQDLDPRRYARAEQRAYWINLYNALTVDLVLRHYPVKSIRDIHEDLIAFGPWDDPIAAVAGQTLSLNDIEHRILRPLWKDPRLHYALNCASLSCPNLAARAYTVANTGALLEVGARAYVNHPRGVRVEGKRLIVSSIYHWYRVDFGATDTALLAHFTRYAEPALAATLKAFHGRIADDYDWALNEP